jgi:endonuclease/exonuclease/phosphatase family metal-dependent hydrolase
MTPTDNTTSPLDHNLEKYFPQLLPFQSTEEMERSAIYGEIKEEAERVLTTVVQENFAPAEQSASDGVVHAVAWNIERGNRFEGIAHALKTHPELKDKDLLLLTELDHGMVRSGNRFVARELAQELKLNYAFVPCYLALQKGSGVEADIEGENTKAIHGLAMFSRYPMKNVHSIGLPNGIDKMRGKEKRLGTLRALIAEIAHQAGIFRAVTLHLDAHSSRAHRQMQMRLLLEHLATLPEMPTLIGGDWNTTTYNAHRAYRAILGYARGVFLIGVKKMITVHFPHPDRFFERGLFNELEKRDYDYKSLNVTGGGTLHYDRDNLAYNTNLGDWVPKWCFAWIYWALEKNGGKCSLKLDWFAGKGVSAAPGTEPKVVGKLRDAEAPLSDHDAITLDFVL